MCSMRRTTASPRMADTLAGAADRRHPFHFPRLGWRGATGHGDALDEETLHSRRVEQETISRSLSDEGDLLLYGCNVAQGQTGIDFIGKLAQATGADVAASDDLTGNAGWRRGLVLETASGAISAATLDLRAYQNLFTEDFETDLSGRRQNLHE